MSGRPPRTSQRRFRRTGASSVLAAALAWQVWSSTATAQAPAVASSQSYHVSVWTTANGLPQGTVNDIVQTEDGALWIATFAGLLRFDGISFRCFDLETLPGLPSIRITALTSDGEGGLWVAMQSGQLLRVHEGAITAVYQPSRPDEVLAIARGRTGAVWLRGSSGAVLRFADGHWSEPLGPQTGGGTYENLCVDLAGRATSCAGNQLVRFGSMGERVETIEAPARILALTSTAEDETWIGLSDGLARFHGGSISRARVDPPVTSSVSAILSDGMGGFWLGTGQGLCHLVPSSTPDAWVQVPVPGLPPAFSIRSLARDREGNVWVGSASQGLARLAPFRLPCFRPESPQQAVTSLADDGEGGAWIAYAQGGLGRVRAGSSALEFQAFPVETRQQPAFNSLMHDLRGRLWIGVDARIARLDRTILAPLPSDPAFVVRAGAMVTTKNGDVWARYGAAGSLVRIGDDDTVAETVQFPTGIISLTAAPDGSLWIGGSGQVWHRSGDRLDRFGEAEGMPRCDVRDVLADPDGRVWIATYGGGLGLLSNGRVLRIARTQGLADNSLSRILSDHLDRLWILSNQGLMVAERKDLIAVAEGRAARLDPVVIGPEAGMPEGNFGLPAGCRDTGGRLWFGTVAGAVCIDPHEFPFNHIAPTVRIESVLAEDVALEHSNAVEVPPRTKRLVFEFTTFALRVPGRVHFRYRLDGFDDAWVDNDALRHASFTALSPGPYTFRVEARNEDGIWSESPASISVVVLPAWWETGEFRTLVALVAIASLYVLDSLRIGIIRRRARTLLEATEGRARAEERESRLREELAHVSRVSTAGELATSLAHEVNQPLAAIVTNAEAGRRFLARENYERSEIDAILRDIAQQGQRASEVIRRLREFLRKHPTERRLLDVNQVVRDTLPLVRRELEDHRVDLVLELSDTLPPVTADPIQIQQVVVNLVNNACEAMSRISTERRIEICTTGHDGRVVLDVRDTGPGIPSTVMGQIFEPYVTTKASGMGLGLAICRSIVESHGGRLSAAAASGGAVFSVDLPQSSQSEVNS